MSFFVGRVVSPTPTPLSSGRVVPALVASYDMHGRAVGLFYTQPTVLGRDKEKEGIMNGEREREILLSEYQDFRSRKRGERGWKQPTLRCLRLG